MASAQQAHALQKADSFRTRGLGVMARIGKRLVLLLRLLLLRALPVRTRLAKR